MAGLAAAVVRLVDELGERALEALQEKVQVDDLVDADWLGGGRCRGERLDNCLDLFHGATLDREHDDERHLALRARHLEVKSLVLVAQDLYGTALQAAPADRAVVEPRAVANEVDDAHRSRPILRPEPQTRASSDGPRCTCTLPVRRWPNAPSWRAAACGLPA